MHSYVDICNVCRLQQEFLPMIRPEDDLKAEMQAATTTLA